MPVRTFLTRSEEETIALGENLARELPQRAVVLLIGNLGAGKTTLAKGIVKGLGAARPGVVDNKRATTAVLLIPRCALMRSRNFA